MCPPVRPNQQQRRDALRQAAQRADLDEFDRLNSRARDLQATLEQFESRERVLRDKLTALDADFNYLQEHPGRRQNRQLAHNFREMCKVQSDIDNFVYDRAEVIFTLDCVHEQLETLVNRINNRFL